MLAVVCEDHRNGLHKRLAEMQESGELPHGKINFEPIKSVFTECVTGNNDDYVEIELKRGIESDRELL